VIINDKDLHETRTFRSSVPAEYSSPGSKALAFRRLGKLHKSIAHGPFTHHADLSVTIFSVHQADLPHAFIPTRYARTPAGCEQQITGDTTMLTNTKIALATALILGAASAALANDIDVNPSTAQSVREWQENLGQNQKHMGNAGTSYGYFGSQSQDDVSQSGKKNRNR
jgi:hypothetical protein